jgi:hypothetical protein
MKDDTNWLQTKDVPPNRRHHCSKSQQQCHPRARAMNPQGWFQSVLGFPNQSALKLSQVSQHPQQSKYPTLFYPACTTQENGPPPFSATQSLRQSFSLFQGLQHNWSRISMLELSGLTVVRKTGHRPMHLRHAGLKSWLDHTSDHYNQLSHG